MYITHKYIFFTYQHFNPFLVFNFCSYLYKSVKNNIYTSIVQLITVLITSYRVSLAKLQRFLCKKMNNIGELCVVNRVCYTFHLEVKWSHRSVLCKFLNPNPLWLHTLILKTFLPCISQILVQNILLKEKNQYWIITRNLAMSLYMIVACTSL